MIVTKVYLSVKKIAMISVLLGEMLCNSIRLDIFTGY